MRNQYDKEFKLKLCKDIENGTTTVSVVSKEYNISRPIVSRWVSEYRRYQNKAFSGHGNRLPDRAKLLNVTRQGYYVWLSAPTSRCQLKHEYLIDQIHRIYKQHKGNYGSPRIALQLFDEGIETNKRVVAMLMQREGLVAKGYRKRSKSYGQKTQVESFIKENLLQRQFHQESIDYIWVTDITYISCSDGRLYLSTYIDLATRIPRCYQISTSMKKK